MRRALALLLALAALAACGHYGPPVHAKPAAQEQPNADSADPADKDHHD
jgi:predicted small lipoprotein YifL